eukprot:27213-Eustigmatos_ZCMA.PRE.1
MRELISAANEVLEDDTWSVILPLAYMGRHDEDDTVKKAWQEVSSTMEGGMMVPWLSYEEKRLRAAIDDFAEPY